MSHIAIPRRHSLSQEVKLRCWQGVLGLTRLAIAAQQWVCLFNENRRLMALAFLFGVLIGLIPLIK